MFNLHEPVWTINKDKLGDTLVAMAQHGSSVLLNWGEDSPMWECSWISSGIRFTGFGLIPEIALSECLAKVKKAIE